MPPRPPKKDRFGQVMNAIQTITQNIEKTKIKKENEFLMMQISGISRTKTDPNTGAPIIDQTTGSPVQKTPIELQNEVRSIVTDFQSKQAQGKKGIGGFFDMFNVSAPSKGTTPIEQSIAGYDIRELFDPSISRQRESQELTNIGRQLDIDRKRLETTPEFVKAKKTRVAEEEELRQLTLAEKRTAAKQERSFFTSTNVKQITDGASSLSSAFIPMFKPFVGKLTEKEARTNANANLKSAIDFAKSVGYTDLSKNGQTRLKNIIEGELTLDKNTLKTDQDIDFLKEFRSGLEMLDTEEISKAPSTSTTAQDSLVLDIITQGEALGMPDIRENMQLISDAQDNKIISQVNVNDILEILRKDPKQIYSVLDTINSAKGI